LLRRGLESRKESEGATSVYITLWNKATFQFEEGETEQEAWVNSTHKPLVPGRHLSERRIKYIKDRDPILHKPAV
jgi:hypothetical protein